MENITASFNDWVEMGKAATALRQQGAIDIVLMTDNEPDAAESISSHLSSLAPNKKPAGFTLQVVVESSRFRQAEETIAKYGGNAAW